MQPCLNLCADAQLGSPRCSLGLEAFTPFVRRDASSIDSAMWQLTMMRSFVMVAFCNSLHCRFHSSPDCYFHWGFFCSVLVQLRSQMGTRDHVTSNSPATWATKDQPSSPRKCSECTSTYVVVRVTKAKEATAGSLQDRDPPPDMKQVQPTPAREVTEPGRTSL